MVLFATAALAVLSFQTPQAAPSPKKPPKPATRDVIRLVGGEEIVGTILKQRGNYIEVQIAEGTVVGFERSRVARIQPANAAAGRAPQLPKLRPQESWYLLHDAEGKSCGSLHSLVQVLQDGTLRVSEEWNFCGPRNRARTQITMLEDSDEDLRPRKSFYHERVLGAGDRLVSERLVSAEVSGERLVVQRRSLKGNRRQSYRFPATASFPLTYRARLRQDSNVRLVQARQLLFDTRDGEFRTWSATSVGRRKVEVSGKPTQVREITLDSGQGVNAEWIDAQLQVVRREVNGAALVAVRVPMARARRAAEYRGPTGQSAAVVANTRGDLALWRPNPLWRAGRRDGSSVALRAPLYKAGVTLMELDQLTPNTQLTSAADSLLRWLRLAVGEGLTVRGRDGVQLRRAAAIRLRLGWSVERPGESKPWRAEAFVFRSNGRFAALVCSAPARQFDAMAGDFRRIPAAVQVRAAEIRPPHQGPLAQRR